MLNKDDLALLLQCTSHSQLPIIERMLKLALVFSQNDIDSNSYKNHLIAKAIMTILYTNETAPNKRNEIFSISPKEWIKVTTRIEIKTKKIMFEINFFLVFLLCGFTICSLIMPIDKRLN